MRGISTTAALLRRTRVERGTLLLLFLLTAATSFVVAAGPLLFDRMADAGLRYEVERATAIQRNLEFTLAGQVPAGGEPFAQVRAQGDELWDRLPPSVRGIVTGRGFLVESPRFVLDAPPNFTTMVTLAYQDGVEDHVRIVEGRAPDRAVPPTDPAAPPRFEVALSRSAAETTKIHVGDRLRATSDGSDKLVQRIIPRPSKKIELDVVGLFDVDDPADPFWFDDPRLAQASIGGSDEFPIAYATALFAPRAEGDVAALGLPELYHWRFLTDPSRIDAARLPILVPDLRRMESSTFPSAVGTSGDVSYRSGLLAVADRFTSLRTGALAALSIAALGPLAAAAGAVGMVALIIVRRRRTPLLLARARGASSGQLLGAQCAEGLLVTVPAALLGFAAASIAVHAGSSDSSPVGVLVVAAAVTALTVAATWPLARRARRELEREDVPASGASARRIVLEGTIIGIAVVTTWLLRERTPAAAAGASGGPPFDPLLAATPVLVGIAVALAVIRLYPIPVRALAALTARRRSLVPVLGLRSIGRHPSAAYLPLLVLTLTVAIGVFSSVVQTTIERGQLEASWQAVGADFRIDAPSGGALPDGFDLARIEGVDAAAPALSLLVGSTGDAGGVTSLDAVDPSAYAAVVAGTPASRSLPPEVVASPAGAGIGTPTDPIPVVASARPSSAGPGRSVGDVFELEVLGKLLSVRVVALADSFPGIAPGVAFVVAPLASVVTAYGGSALRPNAAFASGPASLGPGLDAAIASAMPGGRVLSRYDRYAAVHDAPLVGAVGVGFGIALVIAAAYAALTVVAVISLDEQRRARELAYLRTLGLTDRQLVGLTVVEHAPPVVLALAVGAGLGLVLAWLLAPSLRLAAFIDPVAPVVLRVDLAAVALVMASIVAVVGVAVGASSWVTRRLEAVEALRMGEV